MKWQLNSYTDETVFGEQNKSLVGFISNYTVSKKIHYNIVHNFAKCWPIFQMFSLTDSLVNMQQNRL